MKCGKIKICYKHQKEDLSYLFIQAKAKINFLEKA